MEHVGEEMRDGEDACLFPVLNTAFEGHDASFCVSPPRRIPKDTLGSFYVDNDDITQFMIFQLAWSIVLRAYTGSERPAFIYSDGALPEEGVPHLVDICSVELDDDEEIAHLLRKIETKSSHADCRNGHHVNTALKFEDAVEPATALVSTSSSPYALLIPDANSPKTDVSVRIDITSDLDSWNLSLSYSTAVLSDDQALQVADALAHTVQQLTTSTHLRSVDCFSPLSLKQLGEWNSEEPEHVQRCVHDLILEQCSRNPDAQAVCSWDGDFTYGELERLSRMVASRLIVLGIVPDTFVGLYFEKSKWTTVALLGILRAGGAYVFLDPSFPTERLQQMCQQANVLAILTSAQLSSEADTISPLVYTVNEPSIDEMKLSPETLSPHGQAQPHHAAYVVFTSGSTGVPKGAIVNHSSYCSGQNKFLDFVRLGSESRLLQFSSYAFDMSNYEHLSPLMAGGCICVPSEAARRSNLAQAARDMRVDHLALTLTVARLLKPADFPSLETLLLVGEPPSSNDVATWAGHCRLVNAYGPCECSVYTTAHAYTPGVMQHPTVVGKGIGARCWVTDPADVNKLLPVGAVGELIIEGPIVGRGYIDNAARNEEAFITAPVWRGSFPGTPSGKFYRTGDLVQYVSNGELRCLGRKDDQTKLRGQRLELGEVQRHVKAAFEGHAHTTFAEIIVPKDAPNGAPSLVAFVYMASSADVEEGSEPSPPGDDHSLFSKPSIEFRRLAQAALSSLRQSLAPYMVPAVIVEIASAPTTKTGKSDRRRLRNEAQLLTRAELEAFTRDTVERRQPITLNEHTLSRLIQKVLGIEDVGMNDDFFHLGGDSVLAMELSRLVREEAGLELLVGAVFRSPVLADLARNFTDGASEHEVQPFSLLGDGMGRDDVLHMAQTACGLPSLTDVKDIYPCTPLQEAMMAISMTGSEATYVIRSVYRIPRAIDPDLLKYAWDRIIASNPILRTRIIQPKHDHALQVVTGEKVQWRSYDTLDHGLAEESKRKMQLGTPLLNLALIGESSKSRFLILTIHHALCDGWTLHRMFLQVEAAYYGTVPSPCPFNAVVRYQLNSDQDAMQDYWKTRLSDFEGTHFPSPPSGHSNNYRPINIQTARRTIASARPPTGVRATTASVLQLAWALTISQYGGLDDVVFGSTVSGRNIPVQGIDDILGPTLATVPLRIALPRDDKVLDLLEKVHRSNVEVIPFEHMGLQKISGLSSGAAAACRFQNLLVIQPWNMDEDASAIFGNELEACSDEVVGNYILTIEAILERHGSVRLVVEHDGDVIPGDFMTKILDQLAHNVEQITKDVNKIVGDLETLSFTDSKTINLWNNHVPEAINCCVHDVINRRALGFPDTLAVESWDGSLTYMELERHATRMASHIQAMGAGPGTFVLIYVGKSFWTIIAVLAVMKAGATFVLVDPAQPLARLRQICGDTRAKFVLSSKKYRPNASALELPVLQVDCGGTDNLEGQKSPAVNLQATPVTPSDIAYAVFTSGSTGRPKGVLIQHRAFLTSAIINGSKQHIDSTSRVIQLASFTFDSAIAEILYTLVHGGCVCIPSEAESRDNLEKAMNDYKATWATLTPSLARALDPSKLTTLRTLALGGEAVTKVDIDMWAGYVTLGNGYGPSESSVDALILEDVRPGSSPGNIGRSYAGAAWVVDPHDYSKLSPVGAIGELLLEGPTLAQGYLNDPEKTDAAFVPYPDWLVKLRYGKVGRLYKTGDLVQYDPTINGSIKYLGRKDNQVKLRGQRIELAEVEHHLRECIEGTKAVIAEIVKPADDAAEPVLAAFILLEKNSVLHSDTLLASTEPGGWSAVNSAEALLRERVPGFMVPALFLPLSRMPVTTNGKIDRRSLREEVSNKTRAELRAFISSSSSSAKRPPHCPEETVLQQALSTLLKVPAAEVGMDDNFFYLGGDSIMAMRLVGLVRDNEYSLSVADVFTHPRLEDLARCLKKDASNSQVLPLAPFHFIGDEDQSKLIPHAAEQCEVDVALVEDIYPVTPMQEALLASSMKQKGSYVAKIYLGLSQDTDVNRLQNAWQQVYRANPILRTRFISGLSGEILQVVLDGQLSWSCEETSLVVSYGKPLVKLCLLPEGRQLLLQIHHALYDGDSLSYLFDQVSAVYHGEEPRSSCFNRFVNFTTNHSLDDGVDFWRSEFAGMNRDMFPTQQQPKPIGSPVQRDTIVESFTLEAASEESSFTLPTIIHLASAVVFGHYMASEDVTYGLTLAGKNGSIKDADGVVGPTVTTVPFRVLLDFEKSTSENLSEVQNHLLRLGPYEQTGLQNISSIDSNTSAACGFKTHVIVQPADAPDHDGSLAPFKEVQPSEDQSMDFSSYPLVVVYSFSADKKSLTIKANIDTSYMIKEDTSRLLHQLHHVLQQMITSQSLSLREIEFVSACDLKQLEALNHTIPEPMERSLHDLVYENCKLHPDMPAISSWDGALSYGELLVASTKLAHHLLEAGISNQNITVICMEKSCWTIVAILAVLQAGSACALVDASHPQGRIQEIISQTKCCHVIVSPATKHLISEASAVEVSQNLLDSLSALTPAPPAGSRQAQPTDPALVFFTSGSTGKPKGIVMEHQALATSLFHLRSRQGLNPESRVLHFVSYAFDIAMMEVFGALTSGGCLCIPSEDERTTDLAGFIQREHVNWAGVATSAARLLAHPSEVPSLKTMMVGGEPLSSNDVSTWAGDLRLLHGYGPAECSLVCAISQLAPNEWTTGTIGPMVTSVGWIVNPSDTEKLAAWGAPGELLVEGHVIAREYLGEPEKTALSFIPGPKWLAQFRGDKFAETRLYRTGDIVKYTSEGHLQFIGRKDSQVKLRGQRIELGEVESQVQASLPPGSTAIAGIVSTSSGGQDQKLLMFIHVKDDASSDPQEPEKERPVFDTSLMDETFRNLCRDLDTRLSTVLPRYMLPDDYVRLHYVPETGSGKIDRRRLVDLATASELIGVKAITAQNTARSPPSTEAEKVLASLWAKELGRPVENLSVDDNFFQLGGDSIHAMKLVTAARKNGLHMAVSDVFSSPLLRDMALLATRASNSEQEAPAIEPFALLIPDSVSRLFTAAENEYGINPDLIEDIYPCTPFQEALVSQSMRKTSGAYVGSFRFKLPSNIDEKKFQDAWEVVIQVNPVLRTRIVQLETLMQVVVRDPPGWTHTQSIDEYDSPLTTTQLSLGQDLVQLVLGQKTGNEPVEFLFLIHHALYDGFSVNILLEQVALAYQDFQISVQPFRSFVRHVTQRADASQEYWRTKLAGSNSTPFPRLPTSNYEPVTNSVMRQSVGLEPLQGVTSATILQLAWALVLSKFTDTNDVVFGLILSGRHAALEGIESIAGPTVTTVPMRVNLSDDEPLVELRRLQEQLSGMAPFEQFGLRNMKSLGGDLEAACSFQNLLLIQPKGTQSSSVNDLWRNPVEQPRNAGDFSSYALEVTCEFAERSTEITFDYDSSVLHSKQARRILNLYTHTIEELQRASGVSLSQLDLLDSHGLGELMKWNSTLPPVVDSCAHDGIKDKCLEIPDAIAVCAWDGDFTYQELDELSFILAIHLQKKGVGPEVFVPILMEKSRWVAVAILGVTRAGGAMILLDPSVPFERLETICHEVDAKLIVTADETSKKIAGQLTSIVVDVGYQDSPAYQMNGVVDINHTVTPQNALYAIFTSGSTGKPKGIVTDHRAFYTSGIEQQKPLRIDAQTRTLQFASHMFDVSVADYLWTFLAGGCVCVPSQDMLKDDLKGVINQLRVNRADLTPSVARVLKHEDIPTVKTILLGGEAMSQHDIESWAGKVELVNGYGPSEASVCCVLADVDLNSDPSNIGHAYGIVPWIVDKDDHNKLVPTGAIGELVLEGHTLARGYLGDTGKAAAAFLEESPEWLRGLRPKSRLYKTGDLVQYNFDGTIRYLGRKDTQVKIRGQRVELGEIEHQIRQSRASIQDVIVELVHVGGQSTDRILVAFVYGHTPETNGTTNGTNGHEATSTLFQDASSLHRKAFQRTAADLQRRLPSYMIPAVFIPLRVLPLSPTGKADRRRLREEAMLLSKAAMEGYQTTIVEKRPPRTDAERRLQKITSEVLRRAPGEIGMDDDFFRLGGDSIIALHFVECARKSGFSFRVTTVFKTPKLSELALHQSKNTMESGNETKDDPLKHLALPTGDDILRLKGSLSLDDDCSIVDVLPVSQSTERYLYVPPEYWILNLEGPVDLKQLQLACNTLVQRHSVLRSVFTHHEGRILQLFLDRIQSNFDIHVTSSSVFDYVEKYRLDDSIATPSLDVPITQFVFVEDTAGNQALVLRLSHAQFDGYCLHVLWNDLKCLYEGISVPRAADFSDHVRRWMESQTPEAFDFWRRTLAGSEISRIDNHTVQPSYTNGFSDGRGSFITSTTNVDLSNPVPEGITLATVVKAAWACTLAQLTGSSDAVFTQAVNGRSDSDSTKDVVGLCLNFSPVRVGMKSSTTAMDLMLRVQQQHQQSLEHELLDFKDIVDKCTHWPKGSTHQSMLVHQNITPDLPFSFGEARAQVTCSYHWEHPPDDILIESKPTETGDALQLTLDTTTGTLTQVNADAVLEKLSTWVTRFLESPDQRVCISSE